MCHPYAGLASDRGPVDPSLPMTGLTVSFKASPVQQAALNRLLEDQQNRNSPHYHQWLTPEEFGDRFGFAQSDYDKVSAWLASEGFTLSPATRARRWITFRGTAGLVEKTFATSIHRYLVNGELHYANATNPSIPAALSGMILTLGGLHDFNSKPGLKRPLINNTDGSHSLSPDDFATIYDLAPLYAAGLDGTGQKIAVIGQSNIRLSDQSRFRTMFNLPPQNLQTILVPGQTDPGEVVGDINEASGDIQWAGAIARNASILFVYSGNAEISVQYAIDQNLAPVITYSFARCEQADLVDLPAEQAVAQQANAQGITWLAGSGDWGGETCEAYNPGPLAQTGLAVSVPASLPEVTGVGGTQFNPTPGVTYWAPSNSATFASALSYIPETVWNDTKLYGSVLSSGGGNSIIFPRPLWQTGSGISSGGFRQVPDVALNAGTGTVPYYSVVRGIATNFSGTSAGTPSMAGIIAILNQYLTSTGMQSQPGLGNINPALYRLAQNNPEVFHDVTTGSSAVPCVTGSPDCGVDGTEGFAAQQGYDLATGLGSVDANLFVKAFVNSAATVSAVVPSVDQAPVFQNPTTRNWVFTLTLTEEAGIGTTLTGFTARGIPASLALFSSTIIPAHGSIQAAVQYTAAALGSPQTVLFNFTGVDPNGTSWSRDLSVAFQGPQLLSQVSGFINAASGQQAYAPGMLLTVFGTNLGSSIQAAGALPLPDVMAGFEAVIDGNYAPLYYVSPGQVNLQVPYEASPGKATLVVGNAYQAVVTNIQIAASAPGIFASNGSAVPFPTVKRGDTSLLFITGEGRVSPSLATGRTPPITTPIARLPAPIATPQTVTIGGEPASIAFIGIPSGLVGVTQINFVVPPDAPLGIQQVVITIGNASSLPVNITVTQ